MIHVTRLNNQPFIVNAELVKFVEQSPDTVITLVSGDKIVVRESANEVLKKVIEYRRLITAAATSANDSAVRSLDAPVRD